MIVCLYILFLQGFTPDRLPPSCCHTIPDFNLSSPAKNFFKKAAAALFGGKKEKSRYFDAHSMHLFISGGSLLKVLFKKKKTDCMSAVQL